MKISYMAWTSPCGLPPSLTFSQTRSEIWTHNWKESLRRLGLFRLNGLRSDQAKWTLEINAQNVQHLSSMSNFQRLKITQKRHEAVRNYRQMHRILRNVYLFKIITKNIDRILILLSLLKIVFFYQIKVFENESIG